jgi:hypothetical protein
MSRDSTMTFPPSSREPAIDVATGGAISLRSLAVPPRLVARAEEIDTICLSGVRAMAESEELHTERRTLPGRWRERKSSGSHKIRSWIARRILPPLTALRSFRPLRAI